MNLDLDKKFEGIVTSDDDKELLDGRTALRMSLNHLPQGAKASAQSKWERYLLLKKVEEANGSLNVTAEEVVKLKEATGEFPFAVRALGLVWEWLEGK